MSSMDPYLSHTDPPSRKLPTTAMVVGIVSIPAPLAMPAVGAILGLVAIVTGAIAASRVHRGTAAGPRLAVAGIACGALGIMSTIAVFATFIFASHALPPR